VGLGRHHRARVGERLLDLGSAGGRGAALASELVFLGVGQVERGVGEVPEVRSATSWPHCARETSRVTRVAVARSLPVLLAEMPSSTYHVAMRRPYSRAQASIIASCVVRLVP